MSNPLPSACKADALPVELQAHSASSFAFVEAELEELEKISAVPFMESRYHTLSVLVLFSLDLTYILYQNFLSFSSRLYFW